MEYEVPKAAVAKLRTIVRGVEMDKINLSDPIVQAKLREVLGNTALLIEHMDRLIENNATK